LAEPGEDPREEFIEKLLDATKLSGKIIVYNKSFEIARLNEIARDFPKYENDIEELIDKIIDIMIPFQKKWYYSPEMQGSYSIKAVLPALVPELNYNDLEISDGGTASLEYENLLKETDEFRIEQIRNNLLKYCKLDTFALIKIYEHLKVI
jgi:hypothetical protein